MAKRYLRDPPLGNTNSYSRVYNIEADIRTEVMNDKGDRSWDWVEGKEGLEIEIFHRFVTRDW